MVGILFGSGIAVSGMCMREKVQDFLLIGEAWDPTYLIVMGTALALCLPVF